MKCCRLLLALFTSLSSMTTFADHCDKDLVLVFNGDWAPYIYRIDSDAYAGTDLTILTRTLEKMHCDLQVLPMNRRRSDMESKKGTFDFYAGASFTHERNQHFYFSAPYRQETIGYMINSDQHKHTGSLSQLMDSGASVAINMDGYFGETIESFKNEYPEQFIHEFSLPNRLAMLAQEEADIVVDDMTALCQETLQPGIDSMAIADETLHTDAIHFMLNRKTLSVDFVNAFNRHLREVLEENPGLHRNQCDMALSRR